ncbi:hypothetical protein BPTFM16_02610 [Altererythrobacter insulae]|nr:hypothetical protein BPTFM16_02610 [Altererythrobacter insulae]
MTDDTRELDLDIVSTSWRSLSDPDGFSAMMEAWDRKLAAAHREPRIPLIDGILRNQLGSIDSLLDDRHDIQIDDPLDKVLAETPAPGMVLSPDGLVANLNFGAAEYFGVQQGMRAGTDWLRADSVSDYNAVRASGLGKGNSDYAIARVDRNSQRVTLAEVYRLPLDDTDGDYTVVRSLELEWDKAVTTALMKAFGLTRAETEICELLFAHLDLTLIADHRDVSLETVRTQMKRVLAKVEVHSKTELVRLLALLCASAAAKREKVDLTWSDPLGRERFFVRRNGRKLAHSWVGAENGRPVLFVAGQTSFSFFPEVIRSRLEAENIKLIVPSIPGHGNSDPSPNEDQLSDGCDAIEEWIESMNVGPLPVMASRGAQFYITHLAIKRPNLFSFLMMVGLPWNITPKRTETIDKDHITLIRLSQSSPRAYHIAVRLGYMMVKRYGPDYYWKKGYSHNWADRQTTSDIEMLPLLRATVQHIGNQGYRAFMREQEMCARSPISEWVKQLQTPFHWMVPGLTINLNEDDLDEIRDLNSLSTLEVVPDTGELLPFQTPELFVDRLIALANNEPAAAFSARFGSNFGANRSIYLALES